MGAAAGIRADGAGRLEPRGDALTHGARDEQVRVWLGGDADELRMLVWDGGTPLPPELLPVILEPFRREPKTGSVSNARGLLGLGLTSRSRS
jgi:signal transduction histidine kinase